MQRMLCAVLCAFWGWRTDTWEKRLLLSLLKFLSALGEGQHCSPCHHLGKNTEGHLQSKNVSLMENTCIYEHPCVGWMMARVRGGQLEALLRKRFSEGIVEVSFYSESSPFPQRSACSLSSLPLFRAPGAPSHTHHTHTHTRDLEVIPDAPLPNPLKFDSSPRLYPFHSPLLPVLLQFGPSVSSLEIFYLELISRLQISCKNKHSAKNTIYSLPKFPSC